MLDASATTHHAEPDTPPHATSGRAALCFVHAADLHLDATFHGMARDVAVDVAERLRQSTFVALERLITLCERVRPDALILSGDIYNQEDRSPKAQLAVRDGCVRLAAVGVPVFMVHGNHDPLTSRLHMIQWPETVTVFGEQVSAHTLHRNGQPVAVIHGISHASAKESRNLAAGFSRLAAECVQIGILHTTLGEADGQARYAPCSIADFEASGLDYWALGHVHEFRTVCAAPLAQYPGAPQGLHVGEQGPHGCLLVTATPAGMGYTFATSFCPLGPVEWQVLEVPLTPGSTLDSLEQDMRAAVSAAVCAAASRTLHLPDGTEDAALAACEALIVRLRLSGRTALNAELRRPEVRADLMERLRDGQSARPQLWIKDMEIATRPLADRDAVCQREDLLGEILRLADQYRADPSSLPDLAKAALGSLYDNNRARKALIPLREDDMLALLDDAEALCLDLLEND